MLNERIKRKLHSYFIVQHGFEKYHKGWLRGDCPACGKKKKFGIQLNHNRTNCFVCGYRDKPLYVLIKQEGLNTRNEAEAFLKTFDKEAFDRYEEDAEPKIKRKKNRIKLPEGFTLLSFGNTQLGRMARNYMRGRGFKIWNLVYQGVGYCEDGPLRGYIIFPFIEDQQLIYYQSRNFLGFGPKFNNPEEDEIGIGKTEIIYNKQALVLYRKIYIVESVINALTLGENAIATLGKSLSPNQINNILKSPCKEVIICLDPDANDKAIDLGFKLVEHKKIKILFMPEEQDVNSMGKKYVKNLEKEAEHLSFGQLLHLKDNL